MKQLLASALALLFFALPAIPAGARVNRTITIAAGTPVQLSTTSQIVYSVFIQMQHGGTGIGYVMAGITGGRTPSSSASSDLTAELAPATSTAPGGNYYDQETGGVDVSTIWIDGSHSGDTVIVSIVPF